MTLQLYGIEQAPTSLPIWHTILEDLGHPHPRRVAKVLGLGMRTVQRYSASGCAPRACQLALFWLTRWGRSHVDALATNDALLAVGYVRSLRDRVEYLERELGRVLALANTGASNDPRIGGPHVR